MRLLGPGLVIVVGASLAGAAAAREGGTPLTLPPDVADYREWPRLLKQPRPVSPELWFLCRPPSLANYEDARRKAGPHAEHLVVVYATSGTAQMLSTPSPSFAPGTILAKEKLSRTGSSFPEGVAFMVKHGGQDFEATGGWEFRYYPAVGNPRATQEHCAACHQAGRARDYLLGEYPQAEPDHSLEGR